MSAISGKRENVTLGIVVIIATVFAMSFADAIVKYVSTDLPLWQIFVVRSLIAIPIVVAIMMLKANLKLQANAPGWSLVRSFMLAFMYIAIYAAAPIVSLSVIGASLYTGPLFITLFSALLLGEAVSARRWIAILAGFVGVLVIIRPDTAEFSFAMLIPILAAVLYALAAILTRSKCSEEQPLILALYLNYALLITGGVFTVLLSLWNPTGPSLKSSYPFLFGNWISMGPAEWGIIAFLAVLIVIIGVGLAIAYQSGPSAVIATFDYSYLIFAAFWSYVIFSETPGWATIAGISLIILSGILVADIKLRRFGAHEAGKPSAS